MRRHRGGQGTRGASDAQSPRADSARDNPVIGDQYQGAIRLAIKENRGYEEIGDGLGAKALANPIGMRR